MITEAVDETMAAIEGRMETKVRKGYQQDNRSSPNMVYAKFVQGETRPVDVIPDPHYHVHVFSMNATLDEVEKEWKALEIGNTVGDRTFYEATSTICSQRRLKPPGTASGEPNTTLSLPA